MLRPWTMRATLLLATAAALPAQLYAQRVDPTRIIDMHVNVESENRAFDGSVVEGQRFRISIRGRGTYELLPVLADASTGRFRVTVFTGPEGAERGEMRQAGTVDARQGVPVALPAMPSTSLVIDGVRRAEPVAAGTQTRYQLMSYARPGIRLASQQTECCITCGNVTACGCRVVHTCDFCCLAPCCRPGDFGGTASVLPAERNFAQYVGGCGNPIKDEERIFTPGVQASRIASTR